MWTATMSRMLERLVTIGRLRVVYPDGTRRDYGPGGGIEIEIAITEHQTVQALCLRPVLALGEAYTDGSLTVADDRLYDFLTLLVRNQQKGGGMPAWFRGWQGLRKAVRHLVQRNTDSTARRNVAHHYDISDDFYRLFLDRDMQYSCAYFARPDMTLEQAQAAKKAHIARKLRIEPGMRVLDIGCGWGGMGLTLAGDFGARVTGVTLSRNQLTTAQTRAQSAGLADRCDFRLLDYRKLTDRFDRVVSVGMLEHVGLPHYDEYFDKVHKVLEPDGIALIHTIGRVAPPSPTSPWIDKYIFPGGYIPSLSDLVPSIERAHLWQADIEVLRGHYGPTLKHWRQRFEAALPKVREMYDDRFIRMWRFYLVACEMAFEEQWQVVYQFQLSRQQHAVPATRDYLYGDADKTALQAAE
ncbi:cyclopropane-fatty-acyl-phospholipid synthase family protein [Thalassococcus sp. CAU 1522]|uniref:Cyclopropane-fatty-acyl-phospholipid synthase family protein n=1 Tax=Thalassococcus arenae TaxID=2851652 RepID=A0ABS6N794_9RHOB|nr:cyclopropane-fatty-acyl-phospholipid synthase family protein [Thalassococcus arenae]MBV2359668.1 cyclopropane-fatty-acyl-phospholipid synthase family protein [Thalassococcus arenae]